MQNRSILQPRPIKSENQIKFLGGEEGIVENWGNKKKKETENLKP